ncbi:SPOR domain-containing protein [Pontibacter toksunensis]|uniref:SPOR domain-containing protein n=1 Tax=Pontibacter toksunensis TaxID=1332631 RepID=A0ABW6BN28_9BACT
MLKNNQRLIYSFLLTLLFLFFSGTIAQAQVEPDTTQPSKPVLPTGPPMPTERREPKPTEQPRPEQQPARMPSSARQEPIAEQALRPIDRMYTGGSFGLQFGTFTNISLLPILGYRLTDKFSLGVGGVYHFSKFGSFSYSSYGARAFTQLELFNIGEGAILGHAEVEFLNTKYEDRGDLFTTNITLPLVGVGYRQRISDKASVDMLLLYNVNDQERGNPYNNPVFRVGFNIPFTSR